MFGKSIVKNAFLTAFVSLLFFYVFECDKMHTGFYVSLMVCLEILVVVQYSCKKNIELFVKLLLVAITNFAAFLYLKYLDGYRLLWDGEDKVGTVYGGLLVALLCVCVAFKGYYDKHEEDTQEELQLFPERICDKERLEKYLSKFPCVGVQAPWGNGKSFLVDHLDTNLYSVIKIDLLTCNLNEVQMVLLKEIDRVLKENGIFSSYSPKLRNMLRQNKFGQSIGQLFVQDDVSYSEAIAGLQDDLGKIKKKVLIVYEDLDRIQSSDEIRKVLGISEKISGNHVQVIYQYDEKRLNMKLEGGREYLEKYIPATVNVTEVHWKHILDHVLQETDGKYPLNKGDFQFLELPVDVPCFGGLNLCGVDIFVEIPNMTIRKMECFLNELGVALNQNDEYVKYKKIVIAFFLIKNFYYEIYGRLKSGKSLLDSLLFSYNERKDTILNWYSFFVKNKDEDIRKMLMSQENVESTRVISLMGYHCDICESVLEVGDGVHASKVNLKKRSDNEKIDRIIWSLMSSGRSEFTDYENFVKHLDACVFSEPFEKWKVKAEKLWEDIYYGRFDTGNKRDNRTIFRIGVPSMICVFRALWGTGANEFQWKNMLDYYAEYGNAEHLVTVEWFECISYCDINDKKVYLYVIQKFNELKIVKNMNSYKIYKEFLQEYLSAMLRHGYIDTEEVSALREDRLRFPEDINLIKKDILGALRKRLEKLRVIIPSLYLKEEIELLIRFIDHNNELISAPVEYNYHESNSGVRFKIRRTNENVYKMLESSEASDEDFIEKVEGAYKNDDLTMHEVANLFKNRDKID